MKYSMKWSQKYEIDEIVVKNSDGVESIITGIKTESMSVADNRVARDSQENPCDAKTCEVKYDENYVSHEEWLCLMHEKQLIDELFGEKICLSPSTNQMQDDMFVTTELIKEVEDTNQPTMKDEDLHTAESKIVEGPITTHEAVEDLIIVDELKKVNRPFEEECAVFDTKEKTIEEMASIEDKCKSQKPPTMVNGKNINLQSRKEKLHHYLMARKVKMKLRLKLNKYGPFRKKTKMKALFSCTVVSLAET